MPRIVSVAVLHGDPPTVIVAEDLDTLHWRIALDLVARTPASRLGPGLAEELRAYLRAEQWGTAVERWLGVVGEALDVYESWDLHGPGDVELGPVELEFTPLFSDD